MRTGVLIGSDIGAGLWCGAPPTPSSRPPGCPRRGLRPTTAPPITNEQAKAAAAAAFAEAKKNNWRMAFTIVGPAGELVYFEKMDGTQLASIDISRGKARTAVFFRRPSKAFADQYAAGNTAFTTFPEQPIASEGGVLIFSTARSSARSVPAAVPASRTAWRRWPGPAR